MRAWPWVGILYIVCTSRTQTLILALTLGAGLLLEPDFAVYVSVVASFSVFIYESSHPSLRVSAPVISASGRRKFGTADLKGVPQGPPAGLRTARRAAKATAQALSMGRPGRAR